MRTWSALKESRDSHTSRLSSFLPCCCSAARSFLLFFFVVVLVINHFPKRKVAFLGGRSRTDRPVESASQRHWRPLRPFVRSMTEDCDKKWRRRRRRGRDCGKGHNGGRERKTAGPRASGRTDGRTDGQPETFVEL